MKKILMGFVCSILTLLTCNGKEKHPATASTTEVKKTLVNNSKYDHQNKTIHVLVALCDNKYQGIVPVPEKIGNGQDPASNLYWGCGYGVKSYFKNSKEWILLDDSKINNIILERLVFKHKTKNYYLVADAYDGRYIKECTEDFLRSASGKQKDVIKVKDLSIGINGNASLVSYIGHDGLMNFKLNEDFSNTDKTKRDIIILACASKNYFSSYLKNSNVNPLAWSTNLMSPEAYSLHDALTGYVNGETNIQIQERAAKAYSKYQKCSMTAAKRLIVTGF